VGALLQGHPPGRCPWTLLGRLPSFRPRHWTPQEKIQRAPMHRSETYIWPIIICMPAMQSKADRELQICVCPTQKKRLNYLRKKLTWLGENVLWRTLEMIKLWWHLGLIWQLNLMRGTNPCSSRRHIDISVTVTAKCGIVDYPAAYLQNTNRMVRRSIW